ncbi:conserved hypothetical protein [Wolbachia endosymbiont of Drosophila ananassae]|nr:conserved hypothetical protein [Wolbachia endosymbiont of Drosophila ananassae]
MVEAFYNGMAKVETFEGVLGQIDITGNVKFSIFDLDKESQVHKISAELSAFWKLTSQMLLLNLIC